MLFRKSLLTILSGLTAVATIGVGGSLILMNSHSGDDIPVSKVYVLKAINGYTLGVDKFSLTFRVYDTVNDNWAQGVDISWQWDYKDPRNRPEDVTDINQMISLNAQGNSCDVKLDKNVYYRDRNAIYIHVQAKITKSGNAPEMAELPDNTPITIAAVSLSDVVQMTIQNPVMIYKSQAHVVTSFQLVVKNPKADIPFVWDDISQAQIISGTLPTSNFSDLFYLTGSAGETDLSKSPQVREVHFMTLGDQTSWDSEFAFSFGGTLVSTGEHFTQVVTVMPKSAEPLPYDMDLQMRTPGMFKHLDAPVNNAIDNQDWSGCWAHTDNEQNSGLYSCSLSWNFYPGTEVPDGTNLPAMTWDSQFKTISGANWTPATIPAPLAIDNSVQHIVHFDQQSLNNVGDGKNYSLLGNQWQGQTLYYGVYIAGMTYFVDGQSLTVPGYYYYTTLNLHEFTRINRLTPDPATDYVCNVDPNNAVDVGGQQVVTVNLPDTTFKGSDILLDGNQPNVKWDFFKTDPATGPQNPIDNPDQSWDGNGSVLTQPAVIKDQVVSGGTVQFTIEGKPTLTLHTPTGGGDPQHDNPTADYWVRLRVDGAKKDATGVKDMYQEVDPSSSVTFHVHVISHDYFADAFTLQQVKDNNYAILDLNIEEARRVNIINGNELTIPDHIRLSDTVLANISNIGGGQATFAAKIKQAGITKVILPPSARVLDDKAFYGADTLAEIDFAKTTSFDLLGASSLATLGTTIINYGSNSVVQALLHYNVLGNNDSKEKFSVVYKDFDWKATNTYDTTWYDNGNINVDSPFKQGLTQKHDITIFNDDTLRWKNSFLENNCFANTASAVFSTISFTGDGNDVLNAAMPDLPQVFVSNVSQRFILWTSVWWHMHGTAVTGGFPGIAGGSAEIKIRLRQFAFDISTLTWKSINGGEYTNFSQNMATLQDYQRDTWDHKMGVLAYFGETIVNAYQLLAPSGATVKEGQYVAGGCEGQSSIVVGWVNLYWGLWGGTPWPNSDYYTGLNTCYNAIPTWDTSFPTPDPW